MILDTTKAIASLTRQVHTEWRDCVAMPDATGAYVIDGERVTVYSVISLPHPEVRWTIAPHSDTADMRALELLGAKAAV